MVDTFVDCQHLVEIDFVVVLDIVQIQVVHTVDQVQIDCMVAVLDRVLKSN